MIYVGKVGFNDYKYFYIVQTNMDVIYKPWSKIIVGSNQSHAKKSVLTLCLEQKHKRNMVFIYRCLKLKRINYLQIKLIPSIKSQKNKYNCVQS